MALTVYGLKNCDTTRKCLKLFKDAGAQVDFCDLREAGVPPRTIKEWVRALGWETVLNRRSTTWRHLSDEEKADLTEEKVEALLHKYPTLIKRPVVVTKDQAMQVGFDAAKLAKLL